MGEGEVESTADAWNLEASLTPETRGTREWDELRDSAACAYRASAVAATTPTTVASVPARVPESDSSAATDGAGVVGWGVGLGDIVGWGDVVGWGVVG